MKILNQDYEYAGFHYTIMYDGLLTQAAPHSGQHPAARKAKHIRAAIDEFLYDQKNGKLKLI